MERRPTGSCERIETDLAGHLALPWRRARELIP
jgi:hypothetical protein